MRCETERLVIRPWTHDPEDLERLVDMYSRPSLVRFIGWVREPVGHLVDEWDRRMAGDPRQVVAAIEVRATGVVAGTVLYNLLPGGHHMEVGWHLHPDSERHGYATEAGRAVIERGFRMGVPEVFAARSSRTIRGRRRWRGGSAWRTSAAPPGTRTPRWSCSTCPRRGRVNRWRGCGSGPDPRSMFATATPVPVLSLPLSGGARR